MDPGFKMWNTFAWATAKNLTHFIISIAVLENIPPDPGLQTRDTFSTRNVGLASVSMEKTFGHSQESGNANVISRNSRDPGNIFFI
jgi:hypothetical protein